MVPEVLDRLKDRTGETAHVAVLDGREVVYIARRESDRSLRMFQSVGHRNWAHCTATGKLLLAYLEPEEVRALLPKQLEEMTALTITDREVLIKRLGPIRRRGYAENVSEVEPGVASAAAPIWSHENKVVAAIGAAGWSTPSLKRAGKRRSAWDRARSCNQRVSSRRRAIHEPVKGAGRRAL